ncbi:MAG: VWA domain-containing protein, partial [Chitinophagaceae bacterium]
ELTVMLLVDISNSSLFGTTYARKRDIITEIGAVLSFSAVNNADKIGVIFYSDVVEAYIPPKKGRQHALYIVRELLSKEPKGKGTAVSKALRYFTNSTKQKSIAFVLSDFLDANYEDPLRIAGKKHDVIGIRLYDKMDMELPAAGLLQVQDAESAITKWVDSSNAFVRYSYQQEFFRVTDYATQTFKKAGCDLLHIKTGDDYVKVLQRFFLSRNR